MSNLSQFYDQLQRNNSSGFNEVLVQFLQIHYKNNCTIYKLQQSPAKTIKLAIDK